MELGANHPGTERDDRVILLLDLDCFYAQCERIRLGFTDAEDHNTCCIALLQWDSVLAVSYPARKFGIKRGDGWEAVQTKSKGHCLAVHVPILETSSGDDQVPMIEIEGNYEDVYMLSKEEKLRLRERDVGRRRYSTQGKACLERYRIASRRIFEVVMECLGLGKSTATTSSCGVVLEKASIDEFFLDVTALCKDPNHQLWDYIRMHNTLDNSQSLQCCSLQEHRTVLVGYENDNKTEELPTPENPLSSYSTMERGCQLARWIRYSVHEKLGFTLSAGISVNKMVAKLAAGYGKPNGQAVVLPPRIFSVMQETPLSKVRNFGGKLGQAVLSMLPPSVPRTMGSVAQYLSLPQLQKHFKGESTPQFIFDACRGHDDEPVEAKNSGNLVKSITAFKSLPRALNVDLEDPACLQWVALLVQEVMSRVEADTHQNSRYPRNCTLHYGLQGHLNSSGKLDMKSFRIPFPPQRLSVKERVTRLMEMIPKKIVSREAGKPANASPQSRKQIRLLRIGVCATELEDIGDRHGTIATFFSLAKNVKSNFNDDNDDNNVHINHKSTEQLEHVRSVLKESTPPTGKQDILCSNTDAVDDDWQLAQELQASCDREDRAFSTLENGIDCKNSTVTRSNVISTGLDAKRARLSNRAANSEEPDPDLELAKKLQASYDRENFVLGTLDARSKRRPNHSEVKGRSQPPAKKTKIKTISSFFASSAKR